MTTAVMFCERLELSSHIWRCVQEMLAYETPSPLDRLPSTRVTRLRRYYAVFRLPTLVSKPLLFRLVMDTRPLTVERSRSMGSHWLP